MYYDDLGISVAGRTKRREDEILAIIQVYCLKNGYSPTVREIAKKSSVSSTSTVLKYLNRLKEKGLIEWKNNMSRTIQVIQQQKSSAS